MNVKDKVVIVTGGASGIGRALAQRFAKEGAKHVAVADLDGAGAEKVAKEIGSVAKGFRTDVSKWDDIEHLTKETERNAGPVDLFCSNAGVLPHSPDFDNAASASDAEWAKAWGVNVMAHVYAARAALPSMIARKTGYFMNTVSAAGLLSQIGSAPYSTTKHAAIGFAESLLITHKDHGIKVSCLCPQAVDTAMIVGQPMLGADVDGVLSADDVASAALAGLEAETFLILPHKQVAGYVARKAENYDRWLGGMAKLRRAVSANIKK